MEVHIQWPLAARAVLGVNLVHNTLQDRMVSHTELSCKSHFLKQMCCHYLSVEQKDIQMEGLIAVDPPLCEADALSLGIVAVRGEGHQLLILGSL